jgi:mono/diheme cytochrome c family protein
MKIRLGILLALIPVGALAWQSAEEVRIPDNPLQGLRLFEAKGCVQCHSIGDGGSLIGPHLADSLFDGTLLDLGAALWNHVPGMSVTFEVTEREWPLLSEDEALGLLSFLYFIDYLGEPGDPQEGERVFGGSGGCGSCHVIGGGAQRSGPDLARLSMFASPLYVAQEIWNHGPVMLESMRLLGLSPPTFGEKDLTNLSAYIRQQAGSGLQDRLLLTPGNPNEGRRIFASKRCTSCHGARARGGGGGPDLSRFPLRRSAEAVAGTMWNHSFTMNDAMRARGIDWPRFENSELADLVAFLYFLPFSDRPGDASRGEEVFADRSCYVCHTQGGLQEDQSAIPGPDLVGSSVASSPAAFIAAMWNHAPVMRRAILQEGRHWPELSGQDLRDLRSYLLQGAYSP